MLGYYFFVRKVDVSLFGTHVPDWEKILGHFLATFLPVYCLFLGLSLIVRRKQKKLSMIVFMLAIIFTYFFVYLSFVIMFFALIIYPPIISALLLWSIEEEIEKIEEGGKVGLKEG